MLDMFAASGGEYNPEKLKCVTGEIKSAQARKRAFADRANRCAQRDKTPAPLQRQRLTLSS